MSETVCRSNVRCRVITELHACRPGHCSTIRAVMVLLSCETVVKRCTCGSGDHPRMASIAENWRPGMTQVPGDSQPTVLIMRVLRLEAIPGRERCLG